MKLLKVVSIAFALSAVSPAAAQPQQMPSNDQIADHIRKSLPQDFGDGIRMIDTAAEGDILVFVFAETEQTSTTPLEQTAAEFTDGFCETANGFFEAGRLLRVDIRSESGRVRQSDVISRCPEAAKAD